ncbi:MAG TPA: hypothetical protein VKF17_02230 [Isosphaeraceae bacterium]|nr:hypothetical protein [Isosphaeraceae bacterium]
MGESDPPPVLLDDPRQHLIHDVVLASEIIGSSLGEPQVRLAELLEPHLKVVEAVAAGQGRTREDVVRIQI